MTDNAWITSAALTADLHRLGVVPGDIIMVHAACSKVGPVLGGPDGIVTALHDAVGPDGTIMAYLDWDAPWEDLIDDAGRTLAAWRPHVRGFDPAATRAARDNGILPEILRTTPGALRSGNPGASMAAIGGRAAWLTADHVLDYGYGPDSPLARLVEANGKVLMLGAPFDTMTLMHHAEHLARLPGKRIVRKEVPFATADGGTAWRMIEEYDTADPVVEALPDNFIERIVEAYLTNGAGRQGKVGHADSALVDARPMLRFGIDWLERTAG